MIKVVTRTVWLRGEASDQAQYYNGQLSLLRDFKNLPLNLEVGQVYEILIHAGNFILHKNFLLDDIQYDVVDCIYQFTDQEYERISIFLSDVHIEVI